MLVTTRETPAAKRSDGKEPQRRNDPVAKIPGGEKSRWRNCRGGMERTVESACLITLSHRRSEMLSEFERNLSNSRKKSIEPNDSGSQKEQYTSYGLYIYTSGIENGMIFQEVDECSKFPYNRFQKPESVKHLGHKYRLEAFFRYQ